jgi:NAD(P)-dependent dehydrogenase (short-subunit alcohol dehydrogenase family)
MTNYTGKVAIVTGAASGIGAALVHELRRRGAIAIGADLHADEDVRPLDVTDGGAFDRFAAEVVSEHGQLDLLFNNAGIVVGGDFEHTDRDAWERIVDVNLWGVVHGTRVAYQHMRAQGSGHIVNTASSAGVMPVARSVAYTATKHAVVGLSTSLRAEAAGTGVRVSVVVPGVVDTNIFAQATNVGDYDYASAIQRVPFSRVSPQQAARSILDGVERDRAMIVFPAYNRALVAMSRLAPGLTSRLVNAR